MAREKVYALITHRGRLLVFRHTQFPEDPPQVPGGSVEPGEPLDAAVLREAREETGLEGLKLVRLLGSDLFDVKPYGKDEVHHRHFYHLVPGSEPPERWRHWETSPSEGPEEAIEFEFYWLDLKPEMPEVFGKLEPYLQQVLANFNLY